ncbi:hypothetical protein OD91_2261 [Lutibacter sp. Hel_I_33_5]|uniref:hypothetical protein n=1 Tax=Lutibacter sp. Hel_I_33_5 TaxID=1566289 RepID=UPI0011A48600|nr:hypothetical protein [Lutibacter sp. Hel_I_33_5]TVZ56957.1 hypothetical protein OD91_2261 [Lutibacter sp. Hel_I_33_5]
MSTNNILHKTVEDKTLVWLEKHNKYVVLENTTADILKRLSKGISVIEIAKVLAKKIRVPIDKTIDFIIELEENFLKDPKTEVVNDHRDIKLPKEFKHNKYYQVNNKIFNVEYESDFELYLIHPKFAHLEVSIQNSDNLYQLYTEEHYTFLLKNNTYINSWHRKDIHFFQGKFSMELVQLMHNKSEKEWLGVFHASAISNGKESMLFLGDSGNGKSTSLALLQANGYTCLADDFVPIDAKKQYVYSFPSAISIKRNSLETLLPFYPELETTAEYNFKRLNKIVRYLIPNNKDNTSHLPCKALVFIKYEKGSDLIVDKISNIDGFQQLVPDSWLSPIKENAVIFLEWFTKLPCYQITYSDNAKMIETVSKIFNNEL